MQDTETNKRTFRRPPRKERREGDPPPYIPSSVYDNDAKYAERMAQLEVVYLDDPETVHQRADELLCEMLLIFGMTETVRTFRSLKRHY